VLEALFAELQPVTVGKRRFHDPANNAWKTMLKKAGLVVYLLEGSANVDIPHDTWGSSRERKKERGAPPSREGGNPQRSLRKTRLFPRRKGISYLNNNKKD